jgi:hypothetical protein
VQGVRRKGTCPESSGEAEGAPERLDRALADASAVNRVVRNCDGRATNRRMVGPEMGPERDTPPCAPKTAPINDGAPVPAPQACSKMVSPDRSKVGSSERLCLVVAIIEAITATLKTGDIKCSSP